MSKLILSHNRQYDCPEFKIGDWHVIISGSDCDGGIEMVRCAYKDAFGSNTMLYELLGFELHSQQQGQSMIFFKELEVFARFMGDTCGGALNPTTLLNVATVTMPLALLTIDHQIEI